MTTVTAKPGATLPIGREGENLARKIVFDVSRWHAEYGPGAVSLIARRPGDDAPYPCVVSADGAQVTWPVTSADVARNGFGRCELQYRVDDVLVKSESWRTFVADALGQPVPEPPQPQQAWVDKVLEAGQRAVDAAVNPPKIGDDGTWLVWDFEAGEYVDTGVAATCPAGEPGTPEEALLKTGGTMTGALILADDPTEDMEAATKGYVDGLGARMESAIGDISTALDAINGEVV